MRERAIVLEEIAANTEMASGKRALDAAMERLFDADEHLIVKIRALAYLKAHEGAEIAKRAGPLLRVPNDPLRYEALTLLAKHPNPALASQLAELYAGVGKSIPSRNPNVLRSRVAGALVQSGDASAIDGLESFLREVMPNNGTLGASLNALVGIAGRCEAEDKARIVRILLSNFPGPVEDPRYARFGDNWMQRRLPQIAAQMHRALVKVSGNAELPAPGKAWSGELRTRYLEALREAVRDK